MKLKIDRKYWMRGTGEGMLSDGQQMCCLGFLGKACGINDTMLNGMGNPSDLRDGASKNKRFWDLMSAPLVEKRSLGKIGNGHICTSVEDVFIQINDSQRIKDPRREDLLISEFAKVGVEVEFTGPEKQ